MTSVGSERSRGTREKTQITPPPTQPQKQVQATAEQIRLAQMIYDKNDADFEDKVNQLVEVTGKNQDDCMVALHDCNGDVHRAINILLEGNSDTTSWETVGVKKKSIGKECSENKENRENREKRGDRELSRVRGTSSRRARGGSRVREFRIEENGVDGHPGDRPSDRGRRGRGRGFSGRGRGRGGGRFSSQGMGTFNPADYSEPLSNDGYGIKSDVWDLGQADGDDGTGAWRNTIEEYAAEDWNEDLSETKVFTASSVPAENHITPGQSIDLVALLQNASSTDVELGTCESSQSFGQALVFTNSHHSSQLMPTVGTASSVTSYSPPSLSSVLGSAFGDLGSSKISNSGTSPILEHLKSPGLTQFPVQSSQHNSCHTVTTSSWDIKPYSVQSSGLSQFDFKSQPEPSPVLSQLTQRQQHQAQQVPTPPPPPPPGLESFSSHLKLREQSPVDNSTTIGKILQLPSMPHDSQAMSLQPTQKQMKPQKRRIPPATKIPASAVEMPGASEIQGLNVQFGALEFGTEPSFQEFGSTVNNESTSPISNSLFSKSASEPLNASLPVSITAHEPTHTPSVISATSPPSTSPVTTTSPSNYEQTSVLNRIAYQSPMPPPDASPVTNGHSGTRTLQTANTVSAVPASNLESSSLSNGGQLPSAVTAATSLLQTVPQHSSATTIALSTHPQSSDLNSATLSQLSSTLSSHQNSLSSASALSSNTSHTHTSVEITSTLQPTATYCTISTSPTNSTSTAVSLSNSMNATNSLTLNVSSVSMPAANTRPPPLVSSAKAPPNLPQGVPPLLHSQYIMGPGGLLPAYPQIYGYDDIQMLQSRLPMDYYGIPFPAPLTGRDGGLANNPYSGDVAKFGRPDSASPAPATTLSQPQQNQTQAHHAAQQPFINPGLPPGYSYPGLSYYASMPGVPSAFPYGPTVFVPPTSGKHGVNLNAASTPFQQASAYGQHGYGTGYDDLTQVSAAGDYSKGVYSGASQAQNKSAGSGPGKGVSVSSSNTGVPDISGSVYNKAQTFDKQQAFHAGTPPPFNLPSALGTAGPMNPGAAAGYAPAPFLHILPHQQAHSQMLHHHLQQDGQGVSGQRSQQNAMQQKSQANKTAYASSPYWTN